MVDPDKALRSTTVPMCFVAPAWPIARIGIYKYRKDVHLIGINIYSTTLRLDNCSIPIAQRKQT